MKLDNCCKYFSFSLVFLSPFFLFCFRGGLWYTGLFRNLVGSHTQDSYFIFSSVILSISSSFSFSIQQFPDFQGRIVLTHFYNVFSLDVYLLDGFSTSSIWTGNWLLFEYFATQCHIDGRMVWLKLMRIVYFHIMLLKFFSSKEN